MIETGDKTVIPHTASVDFFDLPEALQITVKETDDTLWVFAKRKKV